MGIDLEQGHERLMETSNLRILSAVARAMSTNYAHALYLFFFFQYSVLATVGNEFVVSEESFEFQKVHKNRGLTQDMKRCLQHARYASLNFI